MPRFSGLALVDHDHDKALARLAAIMVFLVSLSRLGPNCPHSARARLAASIRASRPWWYARTRLAALPCGRARFRSSPTSLRHWGPWWLGGLGGGAEGAVVGGSIAAWG